MKKYNRLVRNLEQAMNCTALRCKVCAILDCTSLKVLLEHGQYQKQAHTAYDQHKTTLDVIDMLVQTESSDSDLKSLVQQLWLHVNRCTRFTDAETHANDEVMEGSRLNICTGTCNPAVKLLFLFFFLLGVSFFGVALLLVSLFYWCR